MLPCGLSDIFLLFRDGFYCEVSSLVNRAQLRSDEVCFCVILYHYKQGTYNIFAAPGF